MPKGPTGASASKPASVQVEADIGCTNDPNETGFQIGRNVMEYNFAYCNSGLASNGAAPGSYRYGAVNSWLAPEIPVPVAHFSYDRPASESRKDSASSSKTLASPPLRSSKSVQKLVADFERPPQPPRPLSRSASQWERPSINMADLGNAGLDPSMPDDRRGFFRADRRKPHVVFSNGFYPKGVSEDLVRYVKYNHPSNFVSMTSSPEAAVAFATQKSGANHIYKIGIEANAPNLIDVNEHFKSLGMKNPKAEEKEFVIKGGVSSKNVFGAQQINMAGKPIGDFQYNRKYE